MGDLAGFHFKLSGMKKVARRPGPFSEIGHETTDNLPTQSLGYDLGPQQSTLKSSPTVATSHLGPRRFNLGGTWW